MAANRRFFLKQALLTGGGLMLNVRWALASKDKKVYGKLEEEAEFNAYIKIDPDNRIELISPNPEGGQNIKTAMPMIVADELDADWSLVSVKQADLDTEHFTRQFIGGSQAIRLGWKALRTAGASARQLLITAAANEWSVPLNEITTKESYLFHDKSGKKASYGSFAMAASKLPIPSDVQLKKKSDFSLIGTSVKNVEGPNIVTGKPLYGIDTKRPGMKIAMIVHPPAFGLKLKSFDAESVLKKPGILDVFKVKVFHEDQEQTFFDTTSFNEVVAIVGENTWSVMQAKKALKVNWESFESYKIQVDRFGRKSIKTVPAGLESTSDSMSQMAEMVHKPGNTQRNDGDINTAFDEASKVIEATYSAPFLAHNCMEPMNFFADVREDKIEMIGPLQKPELTEQALSKRLGVPVEKIDFKMTRLGGGYGRRSYAHWAIEAALISQKVKSPIKLIYSREDDMTSGIYRSTYFAKYGASLNENNELTGFYVNMGGNPESPLYANRFPAGAVKNYLAEDWEIPSNITTGSFRAPRSNFHAAAEQAFLDEVAEAAGKDPIDFRLELLRNAKDKPVGSNNDYEADRLAGVLELLKAKGNIKDMKNPGISAYFCHNTYAAMAIDLEMIDGSPIINRVVCTIDCGQVINPDSANNLMEGAIVDGIGNALYGQLTFEKGVPQKSNFDTYRMIRMPEAPKKIEVFYVENNEDPTGLGEPAFPPVFGAVANALYKATGERYYQQPFMA
ncbi:molybdopterin cofactor-binding domain-containing protein [Jiulongibacter sp. NS-SX5]|uniref:molybdopterin cofactor-binding domain-containing protein n=1 Tax=Jiulongibacter sp. NS-SX5 TaxID=3463854 RepID=UPI0040597AC2